jgi:hypothetical protein
VREACGTPLTPAGTDVARRSPLEYPPCERRVSVGLLGPIQGAGSLTLNACGWSKRAFASVDDGSTSLLGARIEHCSCGCHRGQRHRDVACRAACFAAGLRGAGKRRSASHELSFMTIDWRPTRMCFTRVGSRGSDGRPGLGCTQERLTSARRTSLCRAWPCPSKKFSPRRRGTDWTAGQGSCCNLTVAACAGLLADRRGCRALIRRALLSCHPEGADADADARRDGR